jgi:hypothetical protein
MLLAATLLSGCAGSQPGARPGTATKYRPSYIFGGYSEKQIEPGIWLVKARSNGIAAAGFGRNMAAYRAAELLKAQGFTYMQILKQQGKAQFFSVGGGVPTNSAGEFLNLTVRGAHGPAAPADCRDKLPSSCMTLAIDPLMARLRPSLHIE